MTKGTKSKQTKNEKEPDFGMKTVVTDSGIELSCSYAIPGYTMQDLVKIFNEAANREGNDQFAGNPAKWPTVAGVSAIVDICVKQLYK